ncbi:hypothetical protein [Tenacibaculum aiptasiae]|uniref:hypothetical protein n=1 Tax=Tenacibaculum aiptasiae TaxID=426481 RepID=UPI003B59C1BB
MYSKFTTYTEKINKNTSVQSERAFPFSIGFDKDKSKTKLDVVMSRESDEINTDSILHTTSNLNILFTPSRKSQLPFIQEGEISLIDKKSNIIVNQTLGGLLESIQFRVNFSNEIIRKLITIEERDDRTLSIKYTFKCYDVWKKESVLFKDTIPLFHSIKEALRENINYYYIEKNTLQLKQYLPKKYKKKYIQKTIVHATNLHKANQLFKLNNSNKISSNILSTNVATVLKPEFNQLSLISSLNIIKKESYPKINSLKDNFWRDFKYKKLYWVKPDFKIKFPKNGISFNNSPFKFSFKKIGIMPNGSQAIEGKFVINIESFINKDWIKSIPKNTRKKLLKRLTTNYKIKLPYIDKNGKKKHTYLYSSISKREGQTISLEFNVSNNWVRLLYAALSTPTLSDSSKASLLINYSFKSMVKKEDTMLHLFSGLHIGTYLSLNNFKPNLQKKNLKNVSIDTSEVTRVLSKKTKNNFTPVLVNNYKLNYNVANLNTILKDKYIYKESSLNKTIPLSFDCTKYGDYYTEEVNDGFKSIGCSEPMKIGQIKHVLYSKINELTHPKYEVYKSNISPELFIVVPNRYIISRRLENPEKFSPELFLHGAIDIEDYENSLCVVDLKLEPDISYQERVALKKLLNNYTAHEPNIKYITEGDGEETFNWNLSGAIIENSNTYSYDHYIRGTFETNIRNSQLCKSLLENGGVTGLYTKKLDEGLLLRSQLIVSLDYISQPWSGEGVKIEYQGNKVKLVNNLESPIYIDRLYVVDSKDTFIPVQKYIVSKEYSSVKNEDKSKNLLPIFSIQTDQQALSENYTYIEDLFQQIICFDFLSSDDFGQLLEVYIGCENKPPYTKLEFSEGVFQKEIDLLIPIDEIVSSTQFGYYIKYKTKENLIVESNWVSHNFSQQGSIINIKQNTIT